MSPREPIDGHNLTKEITLGKPLTEAKTINLLKEILEVLSFVHQKNTIHRDLKPANIMRRKSDDKIFLIDFGAVKEIGTLVFNNTTGQTSLTVAIGSHGYTPSEQAVGKPKLASDVYAVGMIAIEALTGLHPTQIAEDEEAEELLWRQEAPRVSDNLAQIIDKMVAGHTKYRYKNASEALNAFHVDYGILRALFEPDYFLISIMIIYRG